MCKFASMKMERSRRLNLAINNDQTYWFDYRTLYDGSEEELNGTGSRSRNNSDTKQESQSAIPDWKSSHAVR